MYRIKFQHVLFQVWNEIQHTTYNIQPNGQHWINQIRNFV